MILTSLNLYGICISDNVNIVDTWRYNILSNGLCTHKNNIYIADWSDIYKLNNNGEVVDKIFSQAQNIHTLRYCKDKLLAAGTSNSSVAYGDEIIFTPKEFKINPAPPHGYYVNSAIPYQDNTIIIGLRSHRAAIFFDVEKKKIDKMIRLPYMRNFHHVTPFVDDYFLASDDSSVVIFDSKGKLCLRSPEMKWPRGILVKSSSEVWVADRECINKWNPTLNIITRKIKSPIPSAMEKSGDVVGGAMFDIAEYASN